MTINRQHIQQYVQTFDFRPLFIEELGWDNVKSRPLSIVVPDSTYSYTLQPIAQKRGLVVYLCSPDAQGNVPDAALRSRIEKEVAKMVYEHILIFTDARQQTQVWQWVKRELGRPTARRETTYRKGQSGEAIVQKLSTIAFDLSEEEQLSTTLAAGRVRSAFDVDRVTKRFYDSFKLEKDAFAKFIEGIPVQEDREWYTSIMLNRLMFVYFIQKRGFLDGDSNYLPNRLQRIRESNGKDTFFSFYRAFLLRLFHEGLAKRERSREVDALLGNVPYLNGSLFDIHELERKNAGIQIADEAFERLFAFFDKYQWHLDDRRVKNDNEINPDVLGYIFEKYINQKQMGAYYTKEDISEYISKNTIIPYLFDAAAQKMPIAFEPERHTTVWQLLQDNPDRYFYDAVKKGVHSELPPNIAAGLHDVSQRGEWNRPAPEEYALPTEAWRELVARRTRYAEIRAKLVAGEVASINDLITYNLNMRQFAEDVIHTCESSNFLRAFYESIAGRIAEQTHEKLEPGITVLDPTCGSGAFLFAALNILQPLYEACLDRMQSMVEDVDRLNALDEQRGRKTVLTQRPQLKDFRAILSQVDQHPNRDYFILKSIIVNNLYGVDIMEEATEICKLRLFLKLAAQVERDPGKDNMGLEPLPDIDFNIRAGNTLVGFATLAEVKQAVSKDMRSLLTSEETMQRIEQKARDVERDFENFRKLQTQLKVDSEVMATIKKQVRATLQALDAELDRYLASEYGIDASNIKDEQAYQRQFAHWQHTHRPFHWFVEFYGIINKGGFDVIIGNPPYVSVKNIDYTLPELEKRNKFSDLYAYVLVRSLAISKTHGNLGMIIPLSITFSEDFGKLRFITCNAGYSWFSSYDNIPAALFAGVSQRCTIWLNSRYSELSTFVAPMFRWRSEYRNILMSNIYYVKGNNANVELFGIPKLASPEQFSVLMKLKRTKDFSPLVFSPQDRTGKVKIGFSQSARNFISVFIEDPPCLDERTLKKIPSSKIGYLSIQTENIAFVALAILAGDGFFWYWLVRGDGFDITGWIVSNFLTAINAIPEANLSLLAQLGRFLHEQRFNALVFKKNAGKYVGNYNYHGLQYITRRADLLLLAGLGLQRNEALEILTYVQRVLSINEKAGEKSIPVEVKSRFVSEQIDASLYRAVFDEIDRVLAQHYGFAAEELDFIINYDIKYRMGRDSGEDEEGSFV